jgi:glutamate racemase
VTVVQQICAELAGAIEAGAGEDELDRLVGLGVDGLLAQTGGNPPHRAILGCTHYPLVEAHFRRHLPPFTRLLSQPDIVADSLEDYLARHPRFRLPEENAHEPPAMLRLLTTGPLAEVSAGARRFWSTAPAFELLAP